MDLFYENSCLIRKSSVFTTECYVLDRDRLKKLLKLKRDIGNKTDYHRRYSHTICVGMFASILCHSLSLPVVGFLTVIG